MKVILNKEERLERSKTLTNYFIEKIDKCKSYEELRALFNEINSNYKILQGKNLTTLYKKYSEKQEKFLEKLRNEDNNYKLAKDSFYKGLEEKTTNLEKLDYITNYKKVFKGLKNISSDKKKEFYETLETLENNIKLRLEEEKLLEKSKTLTNNFIEKIDKSKTDEELEATYNLIVSNKDLIINDMIILIKKFIKKTLKEEQRLEKELNKINNYDLVKYNFYKELEKKSTDLEKLDYITNSKKDFKGLNTIGPTYRKEFYKELKDLEIDIKQSIKLEKLEQLEQLKQEKILEKSRTLTNNFIEKIDKSKTNKELDAAYNLYKSNKDLVIDHKLILIKKFIEKNLKEKQK